MSIKVWSRVRSAAVCAGLISIIGCGAGDRNGDPATPGGGLPVSAASPTPAAELDPRGVVLFLGTSLTAGYGLPIEQSFPALLQEKIDSAGLPFRAVNAGVSGETSAGALRRVDWLLGQSFDVLVIETGGNDMLRGTPPEETERNIRQIVEAVRARAPQARIILAGMLAAPNLGPEFRAGFEGLYPRIAEDFQLELVPFLLDGVAADPTLNLPDGIHPNTSGQHVVAANVWATLGPVLQALADSTANRR